MLSAHVTRRAPTPHAVSAEGWPAGCVDDRDTGRVTNAPLPNAAAASPLATSAAARQPGLQFAVTLFSVSLAKKWMCSAPERSVAMTLLQDARMSSAIASR